MKKFAVFLIVVIMIISTAALIVGCDEKTGTADNSSVTGETSASDDSSVADVSSSALADSSVADDSSVSGETESSEPETSADDGEEKAESFFDNYYDESKPVTYDSTGHFYKQSVDSFLTVEPGEEADTFIVTVSEDAGTACEFKFRSEETDGGWILIGDETTDEITLRAGESFIWKANKGQRNWYNYLYIEVTVKYQGAYVCYGAVWFLHSVSENTLTFDRVRLYALPEIDGELQQISERRMDLVLRSEHIFYQGDDNNLGREHFRLASNVRIYLEIPPVPEDIQAGVAVDISRICIIFNAEYKDDMPDFDTAIGFTGVEEEMGITFIRRDYSQLNWQTDGDYTFGYSQVTFTDYRKYVDNMEEFYAVVEYLRTLDCVDYVGIFPPITGA